MHNVSKRCRNDISASSFKSALEGKMFITT